MFIEECRKFTEPFEVELLEEYVYKITRKASGQSAKFFGIYPDLKPDEITPTFIVWSMEDQIETSEELQELLTLNEAAGLGLLSESMLEYDEPEID